VLHAVHPNAGPTRALSRVGLCALDAELERYVRQQIQRRWPDVRFSRADDAAGMTRLFPQVWLSSVVPEAGTRAPVVVLGDPTRLPALQRLQADVWHLTCPYTPEHLLHAIDLAHRAPTTAAVEPRAPPQARA